MIIDARVFIAASDYPDGSDYCVVFGERIVIIGKPHIDTVNAALATLPNYRIPVYFEPARSAEPGALVDVLA